MSDASLPQERDIRSASGTALTQLILHAPPPALAGVLDNPALDEGQLMLLLRRADIPAELLSRLAEDRRWIGSYLVKSALVSHPHTPKTIAMGFVKFMFWRDLARLVGNVQVDAVVRRMAEVNLRDRVHEISLGERIALARMAPREVVKSLRTESNERVMAALLDNPRATEEDVIVIANRVQTPPGILALLCRAERWGSRRSIRMALLRNPRTPAQNALGLLAGLSDPDLTGLLETPNLSPTLRTAVARFLAERRKRVTAGRVNRTKNLR